MADAQTGPGEASSAKGEPAQAAPDLSGLDIIVPTTAGPTRIVDLVARPAIAQHFASLAGNFRPLAVSGDYHRFADGPLRTLVNDGVPTQLSLDRSFDGGRSWELPVLCACLVSRLPDERRSATLIWATGAVDGALSPVPGDYSITRKVEESEAVVAELRPSHERALIISPPVTDGAERAALTAFAARHAMVWREARDMADIGDALNWPMRDAAGPASLPDSMPDRSPHAPLTGSPAHDRPIRWPSPPALAAIAVGAIVSAGFIMLAWTMTQPNEPAPMPIAIEGLYGDSAADCIARISSGAPMRGEAVRWRDDSATLPAEALCGIALRNRGEAAIRVDLPNGIASHAVRGTLPRPVLDIAPGRAATVLFARRPTGGTVRITADGRSHDVTLVVD